MRLLIVVPLVLVRRGESKFGDACDEDLQILSSPICYIAPYLAAGGLL